MSLHYCDKCGGKADAKSECCPHCGTPLLASAEEMLTPQLSDAIEESPGENPNGAIERASRLHAIEVELGDFDRSNPRCAKGPMLPALVWFIIPILVGAGIHFGLLVWAAVHDAKFEHDVAAGKYYGLNEDNLDSVRERVASSSGPDDFAGKMARLYFGGGAALGLIFAVVAGRHNAKHRHYIGLVRQRDSLLQRRATAGSGDVAAESAERQPLAQSRATRS